MVSDRVIGLGLSVVSVIVIALYGYLVFATKYWEIVLKLTGFAVVLVVFGILAWIGYTLATTPPPKPIEEIEKELEKELKELEKEIEESSERESGGQAK